jgi:hypothetical protein
MKVFLVTEKQIDKNKIRSHMANKMYSNGKIFVTEDS